MYGMGEWGSIMCRIREQVMVGLGFKAIMPYRDVMLIWGNAWW